MRKTFAVWFSLALIALSWALLAGCGEKAGGSPENAKPEGASETTASSAGGVAVGAVIAKAELRPVEDSGVHARTLFKEVGNLGVQVELEVWGLPAKEDPEAVYYAQVQEGSCSEERSDQEHEEHGSGAGPALALVRFDSLLGTDPILAKGAGQQAHGGDERGIPKEPPGSIEQPVSFSASSPDGSAFVSSLLEGVGSSRLTSGVPKYVHVHAVRPEGAPEELACGDLKATKESS